MRLLHALFLILLVSLASCGGGGDTADSVIATPVRIEIAPDTVVLTAPLQEKQLVARIYDADGNSTLANAQWTSSRPGQVSVDAKGKLTATGSGGSAQIIATVGALQSPPLLAVHTQVPAGTVLLTDANINGQPEETAPGAAGSFTNTYSARLVGVSAPKVGDLVINTESKIVAGRVRAVTTSNGEHLVTLGLVPAREMFPSLNIDEAIDLSRADVTIPPEIAGMYDLQRDGNTFIFTPKPGQVKLTAQAARKQSKLSSGNPDTSKRSLDPSLLSQDFRLGPFACKAVFDGAAGTGSEIMALTLPPLFTVALNPRLDVISTPANGLERFVIHSEPTVSLEVGVKALIAAELKATCEAELLSIKIPVGGPLSLIVGGVLPLGVGAELGGKFTFVNLGISGKVTAKTTGDVGVSCPAGASCGIVADFGKLDLSFAPSIDMPTTSDLRIEPSLSTYAFIKASIGNPFLKSLRFDAFKVKVGGALKGNFSTKGTQISDTSYQSDYKLVSEIKAGADTGFVGLAAFFGLNSFVETLLEISSDIGATPVGTIAADTQAFVVGEKTTFTVTLDPKKTDFIPLIGPYNVERVLLVRRIGNAFAQEVASITAQPDQTEFKFSLDPLTSGKIDEFYAFVVTKLLPSDNLSLELGRASGPAPVVLTETLPAATQNLSYQAVLESNLPPGTGVWKLSAGNLPPGLILNSDSGTITGTTSATGNFAFTVQISAGAQSGQKVLGINVSPATLFDVQFALGPVRMQIFWVNETWDVTCTALLRVERTVSSVRISQPNKLTSCAGYWGPFGPYAASFNVPRQALPLQADGSFSETIPNGTVNGVRSWVRYRGRLSSTTLSYEVTDWRGDIDVITGERGLSTFEGSLGGPPR